jgi:hypothetical protein
VFGTIDWANRCVLTSHPESYGKAVMWSRGYAAEETRAAFARAQELAAGVGYAADRFDVYYSQWAGCMVRGEPDLARATAESFIRDSKCFHRRGREPVPILPGHTRLSPSWEAGRSGLTRRLPKFRRTPSACRMSIFV